MRKKIRGSLSLEAAFVLPLYLFFLASLAEVFWMVEQQSRILGALYEVQTAMSEAAYVTAAGETEDFSGNLLTSAVLSETYVRAAVSSDLEKSGEVLPVLPGGTKGISYLRSQILAGDSGIVLCADFRVRPTVPFFLPEGLKLSARTAGRAWTGYGNRQSDEADTEEEMVFVTETGAVYHRTDACTYLRLSAREVYAMAVPSLRNLSGAKYYACEVCSPGAERKVWITDEGNRYHRKDCSALKRTVRSIPLSEAVTKYRPCSRCAKDP